MDDYGTNYEWEGESDTADPIDEIDFLLELQQAQIWLDMGEDEINIDRLMGGSIGSWKISLSAQALKDLKQSRKEGNHLHILKKLQSLASGDWTGRSVARPCPTYGRDFSVRLFQAVYGSNGRILWQVDVGYDEMRGRDSQIVRVWRIGDVKEIRATLGVVERWQKELSSTRVDRCKEILNDMLNGLELPGESKSSSEEENRGHDRQGNSGGPPEQESMAQDMLITGRFHTLTVNIFTNIIHGNENSDFPLDVTGPEAEIIKHKNATFILGRSGTGKTLCLLYKLMCRYLARNVVMPEEPIRQLLLTRSEPLARKLQSELKLLISSQLMRQDDHQHGYGGAITGEGDDISGQVRSIDMGADTTEDLLSLRTEDFPFVCTFDHFLRRIENTITAYNPSSRRLIDYTIFRLDYWPRFPPGFKRHLHADIVFTEIMSVIKGGSDPLSRQEYIDTSVRVAPNFTTEGDRQAVYTLFEHYEKRKRAQEDQDGIDRVRSVMRELELESNQVVRGKLVGMFAEVYVDEVQDQRPLEIRLLLKLVQNPRGIHFAGDSAQCISQDSAFRFANLKTLFYNTFSDHHLTAIDPTVAKATRFDLSENFRSHQGILSLASWVMDKLWRGFPDLVDKLDPEIGTYMGPKPVIIIGSSLDSFLRVAAEPTTQDQVSTQQIIIVRDRTVQAELEPQLSAGSIIFTVLESKGMEYDDVFLYEFFSRSPCLRGFESMMEGGSWEGYAASHANMCNELRNLYVAITRPRSRLFILESNPGLIPELLTAHVPVPLVAVGRFNNADLQKLSKEVREGNTCTTPLGTQKETEETDSGTRETLNAVRPTNTTTVQQWIETGNQCMERGIFEQALRCFKNARDQTKIKWATASQSEQRGKECSARREVLEARHHFKQASDIFLELGMKERAAACLEAKGDFEIAAELFRAAGRYEKAARLYKKVGKYSRAADEYFKCGKSPMALRALFEGKLYERLISDFRSHRGEIPDDDRLLYAPACNKYVRQGSPVRLELQSRALAMFTTDDEKEAFLKGLNQSRELVEFYVCRGRIKEALLHAASSDDFDDALAGMIERGRDYNEGVVGKEFEGGGMRLEDVFIYAQTKRLIANMSGGGNNFSLPYNGQRAETGWSQKWGGLEALAGGYITSGVELDRRLIKVEWIKEYLDTIVSTNIKYFLKVAKDQAAMPHAYLHGLAQRMDKISKFINEKETSTSTKDGDCTPQAMLLALGVMHIPGEVKPYKVLRWSHLHSAKGSSDFDYKSMAKKIFEYLTKRLQAASPLVEARVKELWEESSGLETGCAACKTRVRWGEPHVEGQSTGCSHNFITQRSIQDIIGFRSSCAILAEGYKILRGTVKTPSYLRHLQDYWLDTLLNKLTYHSASFQTAESIISLRSWLRKEEAVTLLGELRGRFRDRWGSWEAKGSGEDFTYLLENYQLGVGLGLRRNGLEDLINASRIKIEAYHAEKKDSGKKNAEKQDAEKKGAGKKKAEKQDAEKNDGGKKNAEKQDAEKKGAGKKNAEKQDAEKKDAGKKDSEKQEAEKKGAGEKNAEKQDAEKKGAGGSGRTKEQQEEVQPSVGADNIFEALRQYRTLHEWNQPSECSMGTLLDWIDSLLLTLRGMLQTTAYLSFSHPSVISIFESILTPLLLASHRTNIVIPTSWTHLYLPLWAPTLRDCTDNEMHCYRRVISRTMNLFYSWVIESNKNTPQDRALQRRCMDLCFVALVNVGTVPGCQELWSRTQKVLTNTNTPDRWQDVQRHQLIKELSEAFKLYNGADTLTLYVREVEEPLDRRALRLCLFATPQTLPPRLCCPPPHPDTLYSKYLITSWYRRRRIIQADYKKYMETDTWKITHHLQTLFNGRVSLSVAVMTDGLDLYIQLQELSRKIGVIEERERKRVEKVAVARKAPYKKQAGVVASRESDTKRTGGPTAADKSAEAEKTESEILHVLLGERNAFFGGGTPVGMEAETWRERCREEGVAIQEMEKILQEWIDRLDGKVKKAVAKKPVKAPKPKKKKAKPVSGGKGKGTKQLTPPELSEEEFEKDTTEDKVEEESDVGPAASRKKKRKSKKQKGKRGKK